MPHIGQKILKITSGCDTCTVETVLKDYDISTTIESISVDTTKHDLILLIKSSEDGV